MEIDKKVAQWLWTKNRVKEAQPVSVRIGNRVYPAARYSEIHKGVLQERLYVVGEMPPFHDRRRICYHTDDSDDGWHLLAWLRLKSHCVELQEAHPFGTHFVLVFQSALENWATEQAVGKRLHRIPMTVTEVGPVPPSVEKPTEKEER